jgi:hypothetical protein
LPDSDKRASDRKERREKPGDRGEETYHIGRSGNMKILLVDDGQNPSENQFDG